MALADWDQRLMTPAEGLALGGDWPLTLAVLHNGDDGIARDVDEIHLCCEDCAQSIAMVNRGDQEYRTTIGDLLSAVLRHMVMAHDIPLNHRRDNGRGNAAGPGPGRPAADDVAGGDSRRSRGGATGH